MLFCKEPTCKSLAVVGGYCLSHQLERANDLYAQLNQRDDSCARMSREITERIGNESRLTQRAEAAERTAAELRAQLEKVTTERDAGCTWQRRYDKQGYPIYDATCGCSSEPDSVEFSGFSFCPYCGKSITVVLESKP